MVATQFHPLLPDERATGPLLERAAALVTESLRLESAARGMRAALAPLLRGMNSYYSNKIEGQHTRPGDIERALHQQFDADAKQARKQRLAVVHIEAEATLESALPEDRAALYAAELVQRIHAELYRRLPENERVSDDGPIHGKSAARLQLQSWRRSRHCTTSRSRVRSSARASLP